MGVSVGVTVGVTAMVTLGVTACVVVDRVRVSTTPENIIDVGTPPEVAVVVIFVMVEVEVEVVYGEFVKGSKLELVMADPFVVDCGEDEESAGVAPAVTVVTATTTSEFPAFRGCVVFCIQSSKNRCRSDPRASRECSPRR